LRIAICDDDKLCREQLLEIVNAYREQKQPGAIISVYESAHALMHDVLSFGTFEIYILDIIMPGSDGIQLGKDLRKADPDGKILYLTSSAEYALESYQVKAFDYILKPAAKERLFQALDETIQTIVNRRNRSVIVRTRESSSMITLDNILYIELANKCILYHLTDGNIIESTSIRTTFSEAIQELLQDGRFALCSSSIAVNMYYVTTVDSDTLLFKNGSKLYIGLRAGRSLRSVWVNFVMNREGSK